MSNAGDESRPTALPGATPAPADAAGPATPPPQQANQGLDAHPAVPNPNSAPNSVPPPTAPGTGAPATAAAAPKPAAPPPPPKPAPVPWTCDLVEELKQEYGAGILNAATYLGQNYLVVDQSVCHQVIAALRGQFGYKSI